MCVSEPDLLGHETIGKSAMIVKITKAQLDYRFIIQPKKLKVNDTTQVKFLLESDLFMTSRSLLAKGSAADALIGLPLT